MTGATADPRGRQRSSTPCRRAACAARLRRRPGLVPVAVTPESPSEARDRVRRTTATREAHPDPGRRAAAAARRRSHLPAGAAGRPRRDLAGAGPAHARRAVERGWPACPGARARSGCARYRCGSATRSPGCRSSAPTCCTARPTSARAPRALRRCWLCTTRTTTAAGSRCPRPRRPGRGGSSRPTGRRCAAAAAVVSDLRVVRGRDAGGVPGRTKLHMIRERCARVGGDVAAADPVVVAKRYLSRSAVRGAPQAGRGRRCAGGRRRATRVRAACRRCGHRGSAPGRKYAAGCRRGPGAATGSCSSAG